MINAYCVTRLDDCQKEIWPNIFVAVPRERDYMQSKNGKILKVCSIIHCHCNNMPSIKIELNI